MEEIAAQAGTSKPVIYRHFTDRAGLYEAVVESVHDFIHADLSAALAVTDSSDLGVLVARLADGYLALVERDPEIYRFVVTRPVADVSAADALLAGLTERIAAHVSRAIRANLETRGLPTQAADTWGHGLVGFVRAAADHWLVDPGGRSRADIVDEITALFRPAFAAGLITTS